MKSFVFWLTTAAAIGALAGSAVRPGLLVIMIIWVALIAPYYGWLSFTSSTARPVS